MKILTAAQMREVDRLTTEQYKVPGLLLMEAAAARTVDAAEKRFGPASGFSALVICGRGNNGGDGAAIARQLHTRGASVYCFLLGRADDARGDARVNFETARALAASAERLKFVEIESGDQLREQASRGRHNIFFDAIFGTGLTRAATGLYEEAIMLLNEQSDALPVVAVDIPSGIPSDSHEPIGPAVRARLTVTFTAPKLGNILPPAAGYNGELIVAPIGSPDDLINGAGSRLKLVEPAMVERWLSASRRSPHANKGDVGKVLVVAGSRGKTGAACLVGQSAMRSGAGLVTIATPASAQPVVASQVIQECMTEPLAETPDGAAAAEASDHVLRLAAARDVLAIGPGLGSSEESTRALVREVIARRQRPVVIDADGLNSLAPWGDDIRGSSALPMILTPHPGEMARLLGKTISDVTGDPVETARDFAAAHSVIVVLKGSRTVIAAPDGEAYINPTGNAGMATGGTGDVLTGLISGLVAQKRDDPLMATVAAVYLHGLAGDLAAGRVGVRAMIASDISAHLTDAFIEVGGDLERPQRLAIT